MVQFGESYRLFAKALYERSLACQLGLECLDRDFAVEHDVHTPIYRAHAALADLFFDLVVTNYLSDHDMPIDSAHFAIGANSGSRYPQSGLETSVEKCKRHGSVPVR